ncbi:NnrU family protein [Polycladidibacter stylochi]|uniref:NnrU family protein n=1 Tax=Polycladidibacter stylochi TaxID=1807766 RepID=UPI00082CAB58|nr:NnrU family protein [Pseudovibrio stylochi]
MLYLTIGIALTIISHLLPPVFIGAQTTSSDGSKGASPNPAETKRAKKIKGMFHGLATIGLVLIIYGFSEARYSDYDVLYYPPQWTRHLAYTLLLPVFPLVCSVFFKGYIRKTIGYPVQYAIMLWASAHLLVNGESHSIILFVSFLVWAIISRLTYAKQTSTALAGSSNLRQKKTSMRLNDATAILLGMSLYLAMLLKAHEWLIGISAL